MKFFSRISFFQGILLGFIFLNISSGLIYSASSDTNISAGGSNYNCGIKTDGSVQCWGSNSNGQSVNQSGSFTKLSASMYNVCGIKTDGSVQCWGDNTYGQSVNQSGVFVEIAGGYQHSCGIKTDGSVQCWGDSYYGQASAPSGTFIKISAGFRHSCGIKTDGTLQCWGSNYASGQIIPPSGAFTELSTGYDNNCGIKTDGSVQCWGPDNSKGQLSPSYGTFSHVASGYQHSCGIKTDGSVQCWGDNFYGQSVAQSGIFISISAGGGHNCGAKSNGSISCWGSNLYNESVVIPAFQNPTILLLSSNSPTDSSTGVSINRPIITATFSEPINPGSIVGNIALVPQVGVSMPLTLVSNNSGVIQLQPNGNLMGSTIYTVTYMTGITSMSGNHLAANKTISFTTEYVPPPQNNTPTITESCPANTLCPYNVSSWPESLTRAYEQHLSEIANVDDQNIADPVTLSNGESTYTNTFMKLPNKGLAYELTLTNRSRTNYNGPIGYNWDHTYNRFLHVNQDGSVDYYDGKLGVHRFSQSASGSFSPDTILRASLTQTASGYTIAYLDGTTETYGSNLHITTLRDASNNQLTFAYDTGAKLTTVTDGNSNQVSYSYYLDGRIMTVSAPGSRSVTFHYDSDSNLMSVDMTNAGNTKTINYTYSPSNSDQNLAHNLVSFTDAKGQTYVTNTYDTNDRITSQIYGSGTVYYGYTLNGSGTLVTKNTVTNRRGVVTEYLYDTNGNATSMTVKGTGGLSDITYAYTYDAYGRKATETKPLGNGTKYTYNGSGNLTEVRVKANMSLADDNANDLITGYTYDSYGNITQIVAPNGKTTVLTYDTANRLTQTSTTVGTGTITNTFSYDSSGRLIQKLDGENKPIQYEYNTLNLPTKVKTGSGAEQSVVTYTYDTYGNPQTMIDGENNTKNFSYDAFDRLTSQTSTEGIVREYVYDANNNKTSEKVDISVSESADTNTIYDTLDKPTQVSTETKNGTTATTQYLYDANGNLIQTTLQNGLIETRAYDMMERPISQITAWESPAGEGYTYDADGNPIAWGMLTGTLTDTKLGVYDTNGNLTSETKNGKTTNYQYDLYDRLIRTTDALGAYTVLTYDKGGNVLTNKTYTSTGLLMRDTYYTYNTLSQLTKVSQKKLEDGTYRDTSYTYDKNGNKLTEKNTLGYTTTYIYDTLGRLKSTTLPNGLKYENAYDKNSNILTEKNISGSGTITTSYTYDRDSRRVTMQDGIGNLTRYEYNKLGQVTKVTDPTNVDTIYTYDYLGNVLTETRAGKTLTYEYDVMGRKTKLTDALGNITNYYYDLKGYLIEEGYQYSGYTRSYIYTYNADGNILTKKDPNNVTVKYTYDSLERVTRKDISGMNNGLNDNVTFETFTYDILGRLIATTTSRGWYTSFTYDSLDNFTKDTNGGTYSITATYNNLGQMTALGGTSIKYTYDNVGRITNIANSANVDYMTYTYSQRDLLKEKLKNNRAKNYVYDGIDRLSTVSGSGYTTPLGYTYNSGSYITKKGNDAFTYNSQNELTRAVYATGIYNTMSGAVYVYDLMGNRSLESIILNASQTGETSRTTWNYSTGTFNTYSGVLANSGLTYSGVFLSGTIIYDINGNITGNKIGVQQQYELKYDYQNRIVQVNKYLTGTTKTTLVDYKYDALGRRTYRKTPTEQTLYYYYGDYLMKDMINAYSGTQQTGDYVNNNYYYGAKGSDDLIMNYQNLTKKIGSSYVSTYTYYYYEKDHLGSVEKISSSTGGIIEEYTYTPFGGTYIKNGSTGNVFIPMQSYVPPTIPNAITGAIWGNTRLYTGREYDKETGLYYLRARHYDPNMGRFLQRDPIGTQDDVNLYRYVANSPIMYTDPTGKVKMVLAETGERLLRWTAEGLQFLLDPEVANSPGEYTYEQDMQKGKEMEYAIKNPSGPALVIAAILPVPMGKKSAAEKFFEEAKYTEKVIGQFRNSTDLFHSFSPVVDKFAAKFGKVEEIIGGDGNKYQKLIVEGSLGKMEGVFEYIKDASNQINHRVFKGN